jgi:LysR family transcriptional regulator (chromosome initiation inhibitor)
MSIDPRRAQAFLAAIDDGSLEAAAVRLNVTPSAISQRIAALEQELGTPLLVRARPCRPTGPGMRLLQFLRRRALLEQEFFAEQTGNPGPVRVTLAVNNDALSTWLLPALASTLIEENLLVEFMLDDQTHTFARLEQGLALACVSTEPAPMRGCEATPLGLMRYRMVAAPAFARRWFPDGITRACARHAPVMVFDRKDTLQAAFLLQHFGLPDGAYPFHYVPSSDPYVQAVRLGLGYGMLPLEQCGDMLAAGTLVDLAPGLHADVPLYWHAWRLQPPRIERLGAALVRAAQAVLLPQA